MRRVHLQARVSAAKERLRTLRVERDSLQGELNQDLPVNIQTLQEELKVPFNLF